MTATQKAGSRWMPWPEVEARWEEGVLFFPIPRVVNIPKSFGVKVGKAYSGQSSEGDSCPDQEGLWTKIGS